MSAENAWRIAMEEAAQSVLSMPEINRQRVAASLQALPMPPAFREGVEAEAEELRGMLAEARRAMGDHFAPSDCYATGPLTGDDYRDLVECPACSFIKMHDALLSRLEGEGR